MNIKEKAKDFAMKVHAGQIRKTNGKPIIYHPLAVGEILDFYGFDDEIISAGYLHDTVEETNTTIEDIQKTFGVRIATLVSYATQPEKDLPWEIRKLYTIEIVKDKPIDDIAVIIADKIRNIEELLNDIQEQGLEVISYFNSGYDNKLWYFESIHKEVIHLKHPIIDKFGQEINNLKDKIQNHDDTKILHSENTIVLKKTL